jgi:site-specific DNA-methyltransferase (adenine-specific)
MNERDINFQEPTDPALNIAGVSRCPSINFFNVDCIEFMKSKPDKCYDLAIVDPPYGIGISSNPVRQQHDKKDWDNAIPTPEYFEQLFRVSKNQIIWGGNYFDLKPSQGFLIWDKKQPQDFSLAMCEMAWSSIQSPAKMFRYSVLKEQNKIHPTQKPVILYRWIYQLYGKEGMKILDTHGGSFNHAIAAEIEGFDLDIMDIDSEYFQAGVNAFNMHKRQQRLF